MTKKAFVLIILVAIFFGGHLLLNKYNNFRNIKLGSSCLKEGRDEKEACWANKISETIEKNGVEAGIEALLSFYENDPDFSGVECHSFAHFVGDRAFEIHKKGENMKLGEKTSVCDYGFYHAFMASFMLSGNTKGAKEFCETLEQKEAYLFGQSCYHGIGHGAAYVYDDLSHDPEELVVKGVRLCENLLAGHHFLKDCVGGVYGGLVDVYQEKDDSDKDYKNLNIVDLCMQQKEGVRNSCFENTSVIVFLQRNSNLLNSLSLTREIPTPYRSSLVKGLANSFAYKDHGENRTELLISGFLECRRVLPMRLKEECLGNMVSTILQNGPPGEEFVPAQEFCSDNALSEAEKDTCYSRMISDLQRFGDIGEAKKTCTLLEEPFDKKCINYYEQEKFEEYL